MSNFKLQRGFALVIILGCLATAQTRIDWQKQTNANITQDSATGQISTTRGLNTPLVTVGFSATPGFDASAGNSFTIALTGNVTTSTLIRAKSGQILVFRICQDGSGAHSFSWPANFFGMGTVSTVASACSQQSVVYDGTNAYAIGAMVVTGIPGGFVTLAGSASGATSLQPAAAAGGTLTLPAATDTLLGRNTADTVQNKTISGVNNSLSPTSAQIIAGFTGCGGGRYLRDDGTCGAPGGSGSGSGGTTSASLSFPWAISTSASSFAPEWFGVGTLFNQAGSDSSGIIVFFPQGSMAAPVKRFLWPQNFNPSGAVTLHMDSYHVNGGAGNEKFSAALGCGHGANPADVLYNTANQSSVISMPADNTAYDVPIVLTATGCTAGSQAALKVQRLTTAGDYGNNVWTMNVRLDYSVQ